MASTSAAQKAALADGHDDAGGDANPRLAKLERKLIKASAGLWLPSSEASDTEFVFVSFPAEPDGLPDVEAFAELSGCDYPEGGLSRFDFGATFDRLTAVHDPTDRLGVRNARGFAKLERVFEKNFEDLAVYRCETGGPTNHIYYVGLTEDGALAGLRAPSIET